MDLDELIASLQLAREQMGNVQVTDSNDFPIEEVDYANSAGYVKLYSEADVH